jgi:hypothetical protein
MFVWGFASGSASMLRRNEYLGLLDPLLRKNWRQTELDFNKKGCNLYPSVSH